MKLISWNVNGLRSIYTKGFATFVRKEKPDILCVQETKAQEKQLTDSEHSLKDYEPFYSSAKKKGYSGVATYIREHQPHAAKKLRAGIGAKQFDSEGRFLITHHNGLILYNTYFPSGTTGDERQDFKYRFLDRFSKHLTSLPKSQQRKLVVCGDFNICHRPIDIHHPDVAEKREFSGFLPDERKWMDHFTELGFVDCFRLVQGDVKDKYTWWSFRAGSRRKNLGWRIDYFFVSKALAKKVTDAKILNKVTGSDHCPIVLELTD